MERHSSSCFLISAGACACVSLSPLRPTELLASFVPVAHCGVIRRRTANQAAVLISSSTFAQIAACLPAAPDRSRSLPGITTRTPWPDIRYCDSSWHPLRGCLSDAKIFEISEKFRSEMSRRYNSTFKDASELPLSCPPAAAQPSYG